MSLEDEVFTLDELGYLGRGKSKHRPRNDPQLYGGEYPFVQTGDVKAANLYLKNYSGTYNDFGLAQSKLWKKGTLVITIAANIAETAVLGQDSCFPDSVVGFEPNEDKVNSFFIKYYIDHIKREMQSISQGTTQDNLSLEKLRTFKFKVPCKQSVDEITEVLLSYDKLIENNNRRIAILEEMAQSLYREWFIKFRFPGHDQCQMVESPLGLIPEGWEVKTLKKSMELAYGKALKKADRKGGEVAVYGSGGIGGFHNTALVNGPCIIVGRKGNVGSIFWCEHDCWPIDTVFYVKSEHSKYYLYFNLLHQTFHNSDAAVPGLNRESAYSNKLILPETEVVAKFDEIIDPMFSQLKNLRAKNENLKKQRDLLLPKLISGQIDLSQAEQASA